MPNIVYHHPSVVPTLERTDTHNGVTIHTYRHWRATDLTEDGSPIALDNWISVMAGQPIRITHAETHAWEDPETSQTKVLWEGNRAQTRIWPTREGDPNTVLAHSSKSAAASLSNAKRKLAELAAKSAGKVAPTGRRSAELGHLLGALVSVSAFGAKRSGKVIDTTKTRLRVEYVRNREGTVQVNWFPKDQVTVVQLEDGTWPA